VIELPRSFARSSAARSGSVEAAPRGRLGYDIDSAATERRAARFLASEPVVWLATIQQNGLPHLVPTWFCWDGEALLVFSKPEAVKVAALRAHPRLMVALGHPEEDFDVALLEAEAHVCRHFVEIPDGFFAKYASELAEGRLDEATFRGTYTQAIRITPTRLLPWRGRGARHESPARPGVRARLGAIVHAMLARRAGDATPRHPVLAAAAERPASRRRDRRGDEIRTVLPAWA
jgi:PPOX class probable F420-dependent enzyme